MILCRYQLNEAPMAGVVRGDLVYPVTGCNSLIPLLTLGAPPAEVGDPVPLESVRLLAPVPDAPNIYCAGSNYSAHVRESGGADPRKARQSPWFFMKPRGSMRGSGDGIPVPRISPDSVDWECELAVVIGKSAKHVPASEALTYVAGYTVFNDFSDRNFRPMLEREDRTWDPFFDWLHGKWHDGFSSMGPVVVTPDERPGGSTQFALRLRVNGVLRQDSSTRDMVFNVAELIAFLSGIVTLRPGDIISTGTPGGVAAGLKCPYLKIGDLVEAEIAGIGVLANSMVEETPD